MPLADAWRHHDISQDNMVRFGDADAQRLAREAAEFAGQRNAPASKGEDVQWIGVGPETPPETVAVSQRPRASVNSPTATVSQPQTTGTVALDQLPTAPEGADTAERSLTQRELIERLGEEVGEQSGDTLRPYIRRAALAVFDPSVALSAKDLGGLSVEDRQVVLAWQQTFAKLGQTLGETTAADRESLETLATELADQITASRTLRMRNLKLCKRVNGYGVYDQLPNNTFLAGMVHPMIVYAELDNFADRVGTDGKHIVELSQEVVLYNESDGLVVWRHRPVDIMDESFNRRHDFFVVQIIQLSDRLTVGKYQLKVTVTDNISHQVDEAAVGISIVADPQLTK